MDTTRRPTIADARTLAKKSGATKGVIIFAFDLTGVWAGASYGVNSKHCAEMGKLMDSIAHTHEDDDLWKGNLWLVEEAADATRT